MEGGLLLDVVVGEGTTLLEQFASEDQALLVRKNSFLVLNLGLHVLDGVGGFDVKGNGLSREGLHENLHSTTETEAEMVSGLFLNVVVCSKGEGDGGRLELFPG